MSNSINSKIKTISWLVVLLFFSIHIKAQEIGRTITQPPHTGFYLGSDMKTLPKPNIVLVKPK